MAIGILFILAIPIGMFLITLFEMAGLLKYISVLVLIMVFLLLRRIYWAYIKGLFTLNSDNFPRFPW